MKNLIKKISILNFVIIVYVLMSSFSFILLLFETKKINQKIIKSTSIPEWKSRFIKKQIELNNSSIDKEISRMMGFVEGVLLAIYAGKKLNK